MGTDQNLALLDAITSPIVVHREGPILFVNRALERLLGRSRHEIEGTPYYSVAVPDDQDLLRRQGALRVPAMHPAETYEFRLQTAASTDGCLVEAVTCIATIDGLPTAISSYCDLSERRRALAREEQLLEILAQIIESYPVPTFVIDDKHKVTHWNRACATVTGLPAADVLGTNRQWSAFYPHERPVMADLIVDGALEANFDLFYAGRFRRSTLIEGAFEGEDYFPNAGEHGCWLFFTAAPIRGRNGRIIGAVETLQDVTARREAEEALRRHQHQLERLVAERTAQLQQANEQLLQSEKLASIGQLAAGVAHEINNPIGYVYSNIGSLERYMTDLFEMICLYESAEAVSAFPEHASALRAKREAIDLAFLKEDIPMLMRESREGIKRVKKIVLDLKDFSHVDTTNEWQWRNLHACIESTLNVVSNELKYKADVVKEFGDIPDIQCLPSQLNQVLVNLLVNSAHAIGEHRGQITIRTGNKGDAVWLEIADTGSGIPEEIQSRIFDPFFTTKPVGKGTGLGLSLSYGIIQRHNGTISVSSKAGAGSVFRIVLPIRQLEEDALP